jgi:hypothetical protein
MDGCEASVRFPPLLSQWCPRGFEPHGNQSQPPASRTGRISAKTEPSSIASKNPENNYPELAKIVQAWPRLRPELKAAIRAIIDASK